MKITVFNLKRFGFFFCLTIIGFVFTASASAKSVTLTYSSFFPPTHIQSKLSDSWCKEVEKRTDGRVKVQYFAGQTLTNAKQTYDAVLEGIADIGTSAVAYTRGRFPVMSACDLPFGYPSGQAATAVANQYYDKYKPEEFEDVHVLFFHAHGPGFIHTRKEPVRKLEDLKGKKIRSTGYSAQVVKALGGSPVARPMPESYQSLQKGVVDGSAHPMEANKGWKLGDVVDYVTCAYSAAYTTTFYVVINQDKWDSISSEDQKVIEEISKEYAQKHGKAWDSSDMEGIRYFLNQGNTMIGLTKEESSRWEEKVQPVIDRYFENTKGVGDDHKETIVDILEQY